MDECTKLAREAISCYLKNGQILEMPVVLPPEMIKNRAGTFVSLHKQNGDLRGCIGTILPRRENIAQEIIHNAVAAAFNDPRFWPLQQNELNEIKISVDILSRPEPIESPKQLDIKKYGLIIRSSDGRQGLLLPNIEGIDSVNEQILIACQKAGLHPERDKFFMSRFTVIRHN